MGASDLNGLLADYAVLEALHRLPDSVALTTDEAAIFLRCSVSTMERLRRDPSGPAYLQGGKKGAKGVNQKCTYLKGELIKYQESLKVSSSMDAAVMRGQAYMPYANPTPKRSLYDHSTKRPFYINKQKLIVGSIDDTSLGVILSRIGKFDIDWLNPIYAATRPWAAEPEHKLYADEVRKSLRYALRLLDECAPV